MICLAVRRLRSTLTMPRRIASHRLLSETLGTMRRLMLVEPTSLDDKNRETHSCFSSSLKQKVPPHTGQDFLFQRSLFITCQAFYPRLAPSSIPVNICRASFHSFCANSLMSLNS